MQEHARGFIIIPVLLCCCLKDEWIQPAFLAAARQVFQEEMREHELSARDIIVKCYDDMAKSNNAVLRQAISKNNRQEMMEIIKQGRKSFQQLFEAAEKSSASDS